MRLLAPLLLVLALAAPAQAFERARVPGKPIDIAIGPDGRPWVLDESGGLARVGGASGRTVVRGTAELASATGGQLAVDARGRFAWLTADRRGRPVLRRATPEGSVSDIPLRRLYPSLTVTSEAQGPVSAGDGRLWLARPRASQLTRVDASGKARTFTIPRGTLGYPAEAGAATDLAVAADGTVWFTEGGGLGRVRADGRFEPFLPEPRGFEVARISAGADGAMYTTSRGAIERFDLSGAVVVTQLVDDGSTLDSVFPAIAPGPTGAVWLVGGFLVGSVEGYSTAYLAEVRPDLSATSVELPTYPSCCGSLSPGVSGLTSAPDGRMWFSERDVRFVEAYTIPGGGRPARGKARVLGVSRAGRSARVRIGCEGSFGQFCSGTVRLRSGGRARGGAVRFAVAAAPAAVRAQSARTLRVARGVRGRLSATISG